MIRADLPRYDELQEAAIDAIPFAPARVLELGFGTAETTNRIWERYPEARITGIDSTPEMVFRARELGWEEMRLGRMQDPLPDGPWDLVIAVLSVHHLDSDQKRDLFRRVREQSRSLVIGDVVEVPESTSRASPPTSTCPRRQPTRPNGVAARSSGRSRTSRSSAPSTNREAERSEAEPRRR